MSEYLKQIGQIDRCVLVGGDLSLQDWLLDLDQRAHPDVSSDGVFSKEEFDFLRGPEGALLLEGLQGKDYLETVEDYEHFSRLVDAYVDQELLDNLRCTCRDGIIQYDRERVSCIKIFQPPLSRKVKRAPIPPPPKETRSPPPESSVELSQKTPALATEEFDPVELRWKLSTKTPRPSPPVEEYDPVEPVPIAGNPFFSLPPSAGPLLPEVDHSQDRMWNLPSPRVVQGRPCRPMKPPKKLNSAEKIGGDLLMAVPQVAGVLMFLHDPGCWGRQLDTARKGGERTR